MKTLVIEPYCKGFEHVKFNSALLACINELSADCSITFLAEKEHSKQIVKELNKSKFKIYKINFIDRDFVVNKIVWKNYLRELKMYREVYDYVIDKDYNSVIFLSITSTGIIAIKNIINNKKYKNVDSTCYLHSLLQGIEKTSKRFWNWPLSISNALKKNTRGKITFMVLSKTILNSVNTKFKKDKWGYINHPYLFNCYVNKNCSNLRNDGKIVFGIMGSIRDKFDLYCKFAYEIKKSCHNVDVKLAGHLSKRKYLETPYIEFIENVSLEKLSYDEYENIAKSIDYLIWIVEPEKYKYTASCVLLDSFNFLKPGIYINNLLIKEYFKEMGDIGYLCNNYNDLLKKAINLVKNNDRNLYKKQVDTILKERYIFEPKNTIPQMEDNE